MKRIIVPLLSLLLCLSLCAAAESVFTVESSGWYYLPSGSTVSFSGEAPSAFDPSVASFTVPLGQWNVGPDLPPGAYSVRCADGSDCVTITFYNDRGDWFLLETLHSGTDEMIGRVELPEGYSVRVRNGSAFFSAPSGIIFE